MRIKQSFSIAIVMSFVAASAAQANGMLMWQPHPKQDSNIIPVICCDTANHGVAYGDGKAFQHQADAMLVALDAKSGDKPPLPAALNIEMVELKGGSFEMGDRFSKYDDERPVRRVEIKPFAIGKYEVLGFQYKAFENATGRSDAEYHGNRAPVTNVSWHDAQIYIRWLNSRTGLNYRLLTEAEWEYAARAGSRTAYHFGDDPGLLSRYANYGGNSNGLTAGSFKPNAWGLYDMLGNVWEWVEDCWHGDYEGAPSDGSAWVSGCDDANVAVVRGGSLFNYASYLRSAYRTRFARTSRFITLGFRLAQDL